MHGIIAFAFRINHFGKTKGLEEALTVHHVEKYFKHIINTGYVNMYSRNFLKCMIPTWQAIMTAWETFCSFVIYAILHRQKKITTPITTTHHCKLHLGKHQHLLPMQTVCHHRFHYIIMIRQEGLITITDRQIVRAVKTGTRVVWLVVESGMIIPTGPSQRPKLESGTRTQSRDKSTVGPIGGAGHHPQSGFSWVGASGRGQISASPLFPVVECGLPSNG